MFYTLIFSNKLGFILSFLILRTFVNYDRKKFNIIGPWKGPVPPPIRMMSLGLRRIRSISNLEPKTLFQGTLTEGEGSVYN